MATTTTRKAKRAAERIAHLATLAARAERLAAALPAIARVREDAERRARGRAYSAACAAPSLRLHLAEQSRTRPSAAPPDRHTAPVVCDTPYGPVGRSWSLGPVGRSLRGEGASTARPAHVRRVVDRPRYDAAVTAAIGTPDPAPAEYGPDLDPIRPAPAPPTGQNDGGWNDEEFWACAQEDRDI